jgi:hypothetical protein
MGKTHHGGDAGEARHFVAAQWLVENLVHGIASSFCLLEADSAKCTGREESAGANT